MRPPISEAVSKLTVGGKRTPEAFRPYARHAPLMVRLAAGAVFLAVFIASVVQSPDLGGLLSGLFGGAFIALLLGAAGAWGIMILLSPSREPQIDTAQAAEIEIALGPVLDALERARLHVVRRADERVKWTVLLGVAAGLGFWIWTQFSDDPADAFDVILYTGLGGFLGYAWAAHALSQEYRRIYKTRVLPLLAARRRRPISQVQTSRSQAGAEGAWASYACSVGVYMTAVTDGCASCRC